MKNHYKLIVVAVAVALLSGAAAANSSDNPELSVPRRVETATATVQGTNETLTYMVIDGRAMLGDIVLGLHSEIQKTGIPPLFITDWTKKTENQSMFKPMDNHYKTATRWPNNTFYYVLDPSLTTRKLDAIAAGMKLITDATAIRFVKRTSEPNFVRFVSQGGCWSYAGMIGGEQLISIGDGCERSGVAAHEMIHALGWMHEHMRPDRDSYVKVYTENISSGSLSQFTKLQPTQVDLVGPYDFDSVMHYPIRAFSKNGLATILPLDPNVDTSRLGQRTFLSPGDIASLRVFYPGDIGNQELKIALSAAELIFDQNKSGQLTLDVSGSTTDLNGLKFSAASDNPAVIAASGVTVTSGTGNQHIVTFTPVANAYGVANITITATTTTGKSVSAPVKITVKQVDGGGGGGGGEAKPFDLAVKYNDGALVSYNGKTYRFNVFYKDVRVNNYYIYGSSCIPGICTQEKPFIWGVYLKSYWTETSAPPPPPPPPPLCNTTLSTTPDYRIVTAGLQKSLTPAGDVAGSPAIVWQDGGAQRWRLQRNAEGYYTITSKASQLALGLNPLAATEVIVAASSGVASQQFCPVASGTGYQIVVRQGSLAIGASDVDGAAVVTQGTTGSVWSFVAQ